MARSKKVLGDNPLFNPVLDSREKEAVGRVTFSEETVNQLGALYKNLKRAYKNEQAKQRNRESDYTRMTFIVNREQLQKLREYAKREGITVKESLERALTLFFEAEE